jgi:hypothetical protein
MNKGRAECGIDIWNRFAVAYQYEGLGIRAFYPRDSEIPETEKIVIERNFSDVDKLYFYEFVERCYEQYRTTTAITIPVVEPLTVTVSPSIVEVFQPVWIEIRGTRGLADIEIYVDDQLIERYENQSIPQRGQYIPRVVGSYKVVVVHKTTGEVASASFIVKYTPPEKERVVIMPAPTPTPPPPAPTPPPTPSPPEVTPKRVEVTPAQGLIRLGLLGYLIYEVFFKRR